MRAHPRSRGENRNDPVDAFVRGGSSPLTRGKLSGLTIQTRVRRLIPAHAGKTPCAGRSNARYPAHPRSRGENRLVYWPTRQVMGSSPLTRGKPPLYSTVTARRRLIPAHAGKTTVADSRAVRTWAHPRSRGENFWESSHWRSAGGSSPLTRGKLRRDERGGIVSRLIPAHAGKTSRRSCPSRRRGAHPRSRGENTLSPTVFI